MFEHECSNSLPATEGKVRQNREIAKTFITGLPPKAPLSFVHLNLTNSPILDAFSLLHCLALPLMVASKPPTAGPCGALTDQQTSSCWHVEERCSKDSFDKFWVETSGRKELWTNRIGLVYTHASRYHYHAVAMMPSLLSSIQLIILILNAFVFSLNITHYPPLAHRTMAYCSPQNVCACPASSHARIASMASEYQVSQ
jgi:hypothetical protein